jgi:hypothetical protein
MVNHGIVYISVIRRFDIKKLPRAGLHELEVIFQLDQLDGVRHDFFYYELWIPFRPAKDDFDRFLLAFDHFAVNAFERRYSRIAVPYLSEFLSRLTPAVSVYRARGDRRRGLFRRHGFVKP